MPDSPGGSTSYAARPRRLHGFAALLGVAFGCGGAPRLDPAGPSVGGDPAARSSFAEEDRWKPTYGKPELARALASERGAVSAAEHLIDELEARSGDPAADDQLRVATADLAVRRRFLVTLEACDVAATWCPPRLDEPAWSFDPDGDHPGDPPVTAPLRFDLESWRTLASELHGRACACRTAGCVDSVGSALDLLELRPAPAAQGDDAASLSVVRARGCLLRLRGKVALHVPAPPPADE